MMSRTFSGCSLAQQPTSADAALCVRSGAEQLLSGPHIRINIDVILLCRARLQESRKAAALPHWLTEASTRPGIRATAATTWPAIMEAALVPHGPDLSQTLSCSLVLAHTGPVPRSVWPIEATRSWLQVVWWMKPVVERQVHAAALVAKAGHLMEPASWQVQHLTCMARWGWSLDSTVALPRCTVCF